MPYMAEYLVSVKTPLGTFSGTIDMDISGSTVTGGFNIMGFSSEFSGTADGEALCFSGSLMTPIGELSYNAEGSLSSDGFSGVAKTRIGDFEFAPPYHKRKKKAR